jgi:hypothetical protein
MQVTRGRSPLVLVAPHAGRRHDLRIPGRHKVNDLMTADVTRMLGTACGASTIVNEHLDRNTLDLNRVSQLRRDAPWMVELMAEMLQRAVAEHGHAIVLMIHGWNVTQSVCDVGVGLRDHEGELVPVRPEAVTVSDAFLESHVRALQAAAVGSGAMVTIGSRYPAAHANNALQLFRNAVGGDEAPPCPIADLCRRSRIEAVQLELAIPLRWPGPRRDRFVAVLAEVFGGHSARRVGAWNVVTPRLRTVAGRVTQRRGLQCVAGETLVMAGIDGGDDGPVAGRVVVSRRSDDLVLFTGELSLSGNHAEVPPLAIESIGADAFRVTYAGPLVRFPMLTPFLDLERGLASGEMVEGSVDLIFVGEHGAVPGFGEVRGTVEVDGRPETFAVRGVATNRSATFAAQRFPSCRITLPEWPDGPSSWSADCDEPLLSLPDGSLRGALIGEVSSARGVAVRADVALHLTGGGGTFEMACRGPRPLPPLHATLERPIPVRRPGRHGAVVETTFALVRTAGRHLGWIEVSVERSAGALDVT